MTHFVTPIPDGSALFKLQKMSKIKSFCISEHKVKNWI